MKKKILAIAVIVICLSIATFGTLAYYTAEDRAHNVITSGGIDVAIEEWQQTETGLIPYPKDKPIAIMPGSTVSKIVTVKNLDAESYIRARYEITVFDSEGKKMEYDGDLPTDLIQLDLNHELWLTKDDGDGWFYYASSVDTAKVTEPFFTEVSFSAVHLTNEYQNCTVTVDVYAQAVQTANNGSNVLDAVGWPDLAQE